MIKKNDIFKLFLYNTLFSILVYKIESFINFQLQDNLLKANKPKRKCKCKSQWNSRVRAKVEKKLL